MAPLLAELQQQLLQSASAPSSNHASTGAGGSTGSVPGSACAGGPGTPQQPLLSCPAAVQLARWHSCLESLDKTQLPPPCWLEVFAHLLLTGALKAFGVGYQEVGGWRCMLRLYVTHTV